MKGLLRLLTGAFTAGVDITASPKEETQSNQGVEQYWEALDQKCKRNEVKINAAKGLKWFPEHGVWALNEKNAKRKARK